MQIQINKLYKYNNEFIIKIVKKRGNIYISDMIEDLNKRRGYIYLRIYLTNEDLDKLEELDEYSAGVYIL